MPKQQKGAVCILMIVNKEETHLLKMAKSLVRNDYSVYAYNNCEAVLSLIPFEN